MKGDAVLYKEVHLKETDKRDYVLWIYYTYLDPDEIFHFMVPVLTPVILYLFIFFPSHPLKRKHKVNHSAKNGYNNRNLVKS